MRFVSVGLFCVSFASPMLWPQAPEASTKGLEVRHLVAVEYPWTARLGLLEGKVQLTALISSQGAVTKVIELDGPEPLAYATKAAVMKWQFSGCDGECRIKLLASFFLSGSCFASENCPTSFEFDTPNRITVTAKSIRAIVN